ncbi:hypothetical protein HPB50_008591 [Hyalomma asiaticum]|uniref:Uncharacterized protein n=1 Tax=Hyalomma asiaticum TaxID=266040 RepID=A0ACB7SWB3_HYAAI|nr:hypothetical protein HPB50_008591 [Hyalomma asiaticum]
MAVRARRHNKMGAFLLFRTRGTEAEKGTIPRERAPFTTPGRERSASSCCPRLAPTLAAVSATSSSGGPASSSGATDQKQQKVRGVQAQVVGAPHLSPLHPFGRSKQRLFQLPFRGERASEAYDEGTQPASFHSSLALFAWVHVSWVVAFTAAAAACPLAADARRGERRPFSEKNSGATPAYPAYPAAAKGPTREGRRRLLLQA